MSRHTHSDWLDAHIQDKKFEFKEQEETTVVFWFRLRTRNQIGASFCLAPVFRNAVRLAQRRMRNRFVDRKFEPPHRRKSRQTCRTRVLWSIKPKSIEINPIDFQLD